MTSRSGQRSTQRFIRRSTSQKTHLLLDLSVRVGDKLLEAHDGAGLQDGFRVVSIIFRANDVSYSSEGRLHHLRAGVVQKLHQPVANTRLHHNLNKKTKDTSGIDRAYIALLWMPCRVWGGNTLNSNREVFASLVRNTWYTIRGGLDPHLPPPGTQPPLGNPTPSWNSSHPWETLEFDNEASYESIVMMGSTETSNIYILVRRNTPKLLRGQKYRGITSR